MLCRNAEPASQAKGRKMRAGKVRVPPWLDLEPGIWQMVFESLEGSDKRCMRLVCRHFNSLASQTIRTLDVRLLLEGCRVDEVPMLLLPMVCSASLLNSKAFCNASG